MSSTHHSLQYIFFGLLLIVVSILWIINQAFGGIVPQDYLVPFALMIIGLAAIATALVWHRLTKS